MTTYKKIQQQVLHLKRTTGNGRCADCKCDDIRVLEFDHINSKYKKHHIFNAPSFKKRYEEAKKCILRCRRCHRIKTNSENATAYKRPPSSMVYLQRVRQSKKNFVDNIKRCEFQGRCELCGYDAKNNLSTLDFDHLHPQEKLFSISRMVNRCFSESKLRREIDKCQLLCANCHHICTLFQRSSSLYVRKVDTSKKKKAKKKIVNPKKINILHRNLNC